MWQSRLQSEGDLLAAAIEQCAPRGLHDRTDLENRPEINRGGTTRPSSGSRAHRPAGSTVVAVSRWRACAARKAAPDMDSGSPASCACWNRLGLSAHRWPPPAHRREVTDQVTDHTHRWTVWFPHKAHPLPSCHYACSTIEAGKRVKPGKQVCPYHVSWILAQGRTYERQVAGGGGHIVQVGGPRLRRRLPRAHHRQPHEGRRTHRAVVGAAHAVPYACGGRGQGLGVILLLTATCRAYGAVVSAAHPCVV